MPTYRRAVPTYRWAQPSDEGAIAALWKRVFGDEESAVSAILARFAGVGNVYLAEGGGALLAHLLAVPCGAGGCKGVYLYALATAPEHRCRGVMGGLMAHAEVESRAAGAVFSCLIPAGESLFDYYAPKGYQKVEMRLLRRRVRGVPQGEITFGRPSVEQFLALRKSLFEEAYPRLMPVAFSTDRTAFVLEDLWAGGFEAAWGPRGYAIFRGGDAPLAAELAAGSEAEADRLLAAIAHRAGREELALTLPCPGGPYPGEGTPFGEVQVKWLADAQPESESLRQVNRGNLYLRFALDDFPQRMAERGLM